MDAPDLTGVIHRFYNELIGERDISAQEVAHNLLGLSLIHCSRTFTSVNFSQTVMTRISEARGDEDGAMHVSRGMSPLQKYAQRSADLLHVTMFDLFTNYYPSRNQYVRRTRGKSSVLRILPKFSNDPTHLDKFEGFSRYKMALHHPWHGASDDAGKRWQKHLLSGRKYDQELTQKDIDGLPAEMPVIS